MSDELQRADKGIAGFLKTLVMTDADRINTVNRRVSEYHPCPVSAFFEPERGVYNAVISGGEKGRECHQYYQRYPERHTAIVHKKGNHTQLSVLNLVLFTHCVPVVLQQCHAGFSVYKNVLSIVAISAMKSTSMLFSIITYSAHRCKRLACTPCTKPVKFSAEPMRCRHNPPSGCCPRHNCP